MSPSRISLLPILLSAASSLVQAQTTNANGVVTIPKPNGSAGWCYYCSDDNAPPLCNSQCSTAIQRLCAESSPNGNSLLSEALTTTQQDCQIKYIPPSWPFTTNGARKNFPTEAQCIDNFNGILNDCGKDAGNATTSYDPAYCTSSGGGGTFGWNDDGSPMAGSARYIIQTANTDQCGQSQASWQQATSVIQWNDSWIGPNDQVVLDTNPPASLTAAAAAFTNLPVPNPECETQVCDIYDNPYYVESPNTPWQYSGGGGSMLRHRVIFEGWGNDTGSNIFFNALHDRCQYWPDNWQVYKNGSQSVADFNLPAYSKNPGSSGIVDVGNVSDLCWCIPYAIFDASVGLATNVNTFCEPSTVFPSTAEMAPVRKRGVIQEGMGMMREVRDKAKVRRAAVSEEVEAIIA